MAGADCKTVGSPVLPCGQPDPCAEPWRRVNAETARVRAMTDVRERNKVISASYARLYQAAPELKWAGAAAFASKQVGCGMDTAHTWLDDYPGGADKAIENVARAGGAIDPVTLTMYESRQVLGAGNLAVYEELYPALRFYQQNKGSMSSQQIMACMDHKPPPPLPPAIKSGLRQTMAGDGVGGGMTMLRHEQQRTLQRSVYDASWLFRRSLDVNKWTGYRIAPLQYVVSSACTSADPSRVVDFKRYGGDLYDFSERWPFARDCANRFVQLSNSPSTRAAVDRALSEIARGAPVP